MISAEILTDSIGQDSPRLTTFLIQFPAFVEQELLRHRSFSFSSSSSRAIPVEKMLNEVLDDELRAAPVWWGKEQKGMSSGDELDEHAKTYAQKLWAIGARQAHRTATELHEIGAHKSIVNRVLQPYIHRWIVLTTCQPGLMNFFGLRLDKAAQPEIRVLAENMWKIYNENQPKTLNWDNYHLPFISHEDFDSLWPNRINLIKISAARCANLTYWTENRKLLPVDKCFEIYSRLTSSRHYSPMEHQAHPDKCEVNPTLWRSPYLHGNLPGWIQWRKSIPGENIAPLPEEYQGD